MTTVSLTVKALLTLRFRAILPALLLIWRGRSPMHCWEDGPEDGIGSTCMLWEDHRGRHEFIPDGEITLSFRDQA